MKKLFTILFVNCLVLTMAAAGDSNDGNIPQEPAQPQSVTPATDSNEPDTASLQQQAATERPTKGRRQEKIHQAITEQRKAGVRQYQAFEAQLADEYQKHNQRLAILNRIRQLAVQEGLADTIQRVDNLIKMENNRHLKKITRLHRKPAATAKTDEPNK